MKRAVILILSILALVLLTSCEKEDANCWICDIKNSSGVVYAKQIMCDDYTAADEAYLIAKGCRRWR
jgi:hypothetical protein